MDSILIEGGACLTGTIEIGGAKNSALPLMAACLLSDETLTLSNLPDLTDITTMSRLLKQHGVHIGGHEELTDRLALNAAGVTNVVAPYNLVRRMRASVLVLGPLTSRFGEAVVSLPGGCAIGTRPVDQHVRGLEMLGAEITLDNGYIRAQAPGGLTGATIEFPMVSVGATENLLMAATLAKGETTLVNAACEPEIIDLANCLNSMGARIDGAGTSQIVIQGVSRLHGAEHVVISDRIEAGTYAMAAAVTGGDLLLKGAPTIHMGTVLRKLATAGVGIEEKSDGLRVLATKGETRAISLATGPYPGFPTDLQAQIMVLMCVAQGEAVITETIFENRFMHVPELMRMGARVEVSGAAAKVTGVSHLTGAQVMATDLRASVSLVLAGLAAEGETLIRRVYHLDRGYEHVVEKLAACGARIERRAEDHIE